MVKKGFTLVEAIISMIIIVTVALGALPVLTKTSPIKNGMETRTIRGQYACWIDDNDNLVEWYFDERTPRTPEPRKINPFIATDGCKLVFDQRPANFYILASSAGTANYPGVAVSKYTPTLSSELSIKIGKSVIDNNSTPNTTVYNNDQTIVEAKAIKTENGFAGLPPNNIKSCKLITAPEGCSNATCKIGDVQIVDEINLTYKTSKQLGITNCPDSSTTKFINFESIGYTGIGGSMDFENVAESTRTLLAQANNDKYYTTENNAEFNFEFINSSYIPPSKMLGFSSNGDASTTNSKMTKMLETIPIRRQSKLIETLIKANPGGKNQNGAVLILW